MAQQKIDYNILLIAGILVGGYFVGKSILEKLGLKESSEDIELKKKLKEQEPLIWSGTKNLAKILGKNKTAKILSKVGAESYAKQIKDAFGTFNDDEESIYAVFRNIRFKTQVASLVDAYSMLYKLDLLTTLKSKLSESEFATIVNIIETKPLGITNK